MKTLLLLLLLCAPGLPGPARAAVPTNPVRGIEAVEPIRERATASNHVHFDYRLDACGGLRDPNSWSFGSWAGCSGIIVSFVSYYGFTVGKAVQRLRGRWPQN